MRGFSDVLSLSAIQAETGHRYSPQCVPSKCQRTRDGWCRYLRRADGEDRAVPLVVNA
jgi:hypothetical protein